MPPVHTTELPAFRAIRERNNRMESLVSRLQPATDSPEFNIWEELMGQMSEQFHAIVNLSCAVSRREV